MAYDIASNVILYKFTSSLGANIVYTIALDVFNRSIARNQQIFSSFVPNLENVYNSCAADQGLRVYWSNDYSTFQVSKQ